MDKEIQTIVQAIEAKKGYDISCFDLRGHSDLCDYKIVCTGNTDKQTRAIAEGVESHYRSAYSQKAASVEGKSSGFWILLDFGSIIVHIFQAEYRGYYAIEELWANREMKL